VTSTRHREQPVNLNRSAADDPQLGLNIMAQARRHQQEKAKRKEGLSDMKEEQEGNPAPGRTYVATVVAIGAATYLSVSPLVQRPPKFSQIRAHEYGQNPRVSVPSRLSNEVSSWQLCTQAKVM
jgi:hypothetical protein